MVVNASTSMDHLIIVTVSVEETAALAFIININLG